MSRGMSRAVFPSGTLSEPERGYKTAADVSKEGVRQWPIGASGRSKWGSRLWWESGSRPAGLLWSRRNNWRGSTLLRRDTACLSVVA